MNDSLQTVYTGASSGVTLEQRNHVLRNSYCLLAASLLATVIKRDLSGMGKFLMVGAWILFFAFIANFFLQSSALMLTLLVLCLGVFSAFMLYDVKRVIDGGETNYISATLAIYLDIYNVFQSLLAILGIFGGERE